MPRPSNPPRIANSNPISDFMAEMDKWRTPKCSVLAKVGLDADRVRRLTAPYRRNGNCPIRFEPYTAETTLADAERLLELLRNTMTASVQQLADKLGWSKQRIGVAMGKLTRAGQPVYVSLSHVYRHRVYHYGTNPEAKNE